MTFDKEKLHPVFRAGVYPQWDKVNEKIVFVEVTAADVEEIARNYDYEYHPSPLWIGHPDYTAPALAWVGSYVAENGELFCKFDEVSQEAIYLTETSKYKKVSMEIDLKFKLANGKFGKYPVAIGFTNDPIVKALPTIKFSHAGKNYETGEGTQYYVIDNKLNFTNSNKLIMLTEAVKKFAQTMGINITEFGSDVAVLEKAADCINKLKEKFSDDPDSVNSLDLLITKYSTLPAHVKKLEGDLKVFEEERATNLIQFAIDSKKIEPAEKDEYIKLAKSNYESTQNILAGRKSLPKFEENKVTDINVNLSGNISGSEGDTDTSKWSFEDWSKKDPKGLSKMQLSNEKKFKELYKNCYGVEFNETV